jgi:hypothetical protein
MSMQFRSLLTAALNDSPEPSQKSCAKQAIWSHTFAFRET